MFVFFFVSGWELCAALEAFFGFFFLFGEHEYDVECMFFMMVRWLMACNEKCVTFGLQRELIRKQNLSLPSCTSTLREHFLGISEIFSHQKILNMRGTMGA